VCAHIYIEHGIYKLPVISLSEGVFYHKYNVLKFRILGAMIQIGRPATCQEIADKLHIDRNRVSAFFAKCTRYKYRYFRRLTKKQKGGNNKAYRYSITKYGRATHAMYLKRANQGLTLNCKRLTDVRKIGESGYIGIGDKGKAQGITINEAYRRSGIVTN
jgi:hypothetical protein